jgi:hypothetical protein
MFRVIQHKCAKPYKRTIAVQKTGVKCREDIVCMHELLRERERRGIGISHSAYEIRKRK